MLGPIVVFSRGRISCIFSLFDATVLLDNRVKKRDPVQPSSSQIKETQEVL